MTLCVEIFSWQKHHAIWSPRHFWPLQKSCVDAGFLFVESGFIFSFFTRPILRFRPLDKFYTFFGSSCPVRLNKFVCGSIFLTKIWWCFHSTPFFALAKKKSESFFPLFCRQRYFFAKSLILDLNLLTYITLFFWCLVWSRLIKFVRGNIFVTKTRCCFTSRHFLPFPRRCFHFQKWDFVF